MAFCKWVILTILLQKIQLLCEKSGIFA